MTHRLPISMLLFAGLTLTAACQGGTADTALRSDVAQRIPNAPEMPVVPKAPATVKENEVWTPPLPSMASIEPPPGWVKSNEEVPPMPITLLRLPRTNIVRAKYPAIDFHVHARNLTTKEQYEGLIALLDSIGMGAIINLNGGTGATLDSVLQAGQPYRDRVANFITLSLDGINETGWSERFAAEMDRAFLAGAAGMKVHKTLGLGATNPDGTYIQADDPRLDPIWEMAAKHSKPIMIHTGDSMGRFYPISPKNERYEAGLWRSPGDTRGNYYESGPSYEEIDRARENMHRKHPNTRFVNGHMAMLYPDPEKLARFLDTHPNADIEISATVQDLGRAPRLWRDFIIKYQDRILFGTDGSQNQKPDDFWTPHWRFLETYDEYFYHPAQIRTPGGSPGHGRWNISGIGLPDSVLRSVYYENALRHLPSLRPSIERQLAERRSR